MTAYGEATIFFGAEQITQLVVATDFAASLETKDLDFGKPQNAKFIDGILIEIDRDKMLEIAFGYRERLTQDLTWTAWLEVNGNRLTHPTHGVIPESRYFRLRLRDPSPEQVWRLTAIQLYGRVVGTSRSSRREADDSDA